MLENLRAIHEPFNKQRIIVGFDTFAGYDREYLANLLAAHEGSNALGHVRGNHRLVDGDAEVTVPRYFKDHPETIVAMALFDIGVYRPTKAALETVVPALVPGSVLVFDELTGRALPARRSRSRRFSAARATGSRSRAITRRRRS